MDFYSHDYNFSTLKATTVLYHRGKSPTEPAQAASPSPSSCLHPYPAMGPAPCSEWGPVPIKPVLNQSQTSPKPALLLPTAPHHPRMKTQTLPRCPDQRCCLQLIHQFSFPALCSTSARGSWHTTFWWSSDKEETASGMRCPWISVACQQPWNVARFGIKLKNKIAPLFFM